MRNNIGIGLGVVGIILGAIALYFGLQSNLKVAYVNSSQVLNAYKGTAVLRKQMQDLEKLETAKMDTLVSEFKKALSDYDQKKATLSPNEIKLQEELLNLKRQQIAGYQQSVQEKLREKEVALNSDLVSDMNGFIEGYASKRGYDFILGATNMGNVVYANDAFDISEEIIKALNKRHESN